MAQIVKNLPAKQETWVQSLGLEDPLEKGMRKTSVFLSRETGVSGNFVGRIQGAKCPFDLQFLTWDFS